MKKQIYLDPKESAVLINVYKYPDGDLNSGALHSLLCESKVSKSNDETFDALERMIAAGFVRGKRGKAEDNSIYYTRIKLTAPGEQMAIRAKNAAKGITVEIVHIGTGKVEKRHIRNTSGNV